MKKRDFLFAGLLLFASVPMNAQIPVPEGPTRSAEDAQEIFFQGFEDDWATWIEKEVDRIDTLYYINHKGDSGVSNVSDCTWIKKSPGVIARTDSVLILKNGVLTTDDAKDGGLNGAAFANDKYTILEDAAGSDRIAELTTKFGINPGTHYFQYKSDRKLINNEGYSWQIAYENGVAAEYRRNLFVRGLPIEENSSYRMTLYIKALQKEGTTVVPTFTADLMRGYFHSEKPFYTGSTSFSETKTEFSGDWEKVTLMSYYANPTINEILYNKEYYWTNDWVWDKDGTGETSQKYFFIKQPNKFFARLAFRSDSTDFYVDNVSLTKSWIAGVEYSDNKIRVDFGYKTNLKDQAIAAREKTQIDAVELPGKYFRVLGYYSGVDEETGEVDEDAKGWYEVEMNSAEYHGDGYMYMWTKEDEDGEALTFDYYDTVLVSFENPIDMPELVLKYTDGAKYPKANDSAWVANGKIVPNFYNEVATKNPYVFGGVVSMKERAPIVQEISIENNSFNLDGNTREITFTFQKAPLWEAGENAQTEFALLQVTKAGATEYWYPYKASDDKLSVTFKRGSLYTAPLEGDYEFKLNNLQTKTVKATVPEVFHYSFGETVIPDYLIDYFDFTSLKTEDKYQKESTISGITLEKSVAKVTEFSGAYGKALMWGLYGENTGAENNATNCAKLFYLVNIPEAGSYDFEIGASGCQKGSWNDGANMDIFLYNDLGDEILKYESGGSSRKPNEGGNIVDVDTLRFTAEGLAAGTYKLALTLPLEGSYGGGHKGGRILYYFEIVKAGNDKVYNLGVGFKPLMSFLKAKSALNASLAKAKAAPNDYAGVVYEAQLPVADQYKAFHHTAPSQYAIATEALSKANEALMNRFAFVDAMFKANGEAIKKADAFIEADEANAAVPAYIALDEILDFVSAFICKDATDDSIKALQTKIEDAVKALTDRDDIMKALATEKTNAQTLLDEAAAAAELVAYKALADTLAAKNLIDVYTAESAVLTAATDALKAAEQALKDRQAIIADFEDAKAAAAELVKAAAAAALPEYKNLSDVFNEKSVLDAITSSDDELKAATAALKAATSAYVGIVEAAPFATARLKSLKAMVENLGAAKYFGEDAADLAAAVDNAVYEDAKLVQVYKSAIKAAIYEKYKDAAEITDTLDLTGFIANAGLYADLEIGDDYVWANIQDWGRSGNKYDYAILKRNNTTTKVFPGWAVTEQFGGQLYAAPAIKKEAAYFKENPRFADSWLAFDWNSAPSVTQDVDLLPEGEYSLGAFFAFTMKDNNNGGNSNAGKATLTAKVGEKTAVKDCADLNENPENWTAANIKEADHWTDFIEVADGETMNITAKAQKTTNWGHLDNFALKFVPKNANYATLLEGEKAALTELISFVDANAADAEVSFFGLDGVKVNAPKAGQITIKMTKKANGARVIEKVMNK